MNLSTCLIVDDSRIIRKVARRIVEGLGYEVDEAADGAEALAAGDGPRFQNAVAARMQPARNSGTRPAGEKPAPAPVPTPSQPASLTDKLRQLTERFRQP